MTDARDPKVTVLMSVLNGAKTLRGSVASILSQSFSDFEFVIVEDGSTDETPLILADLAASDGRIRIVRNPQNLGLTRSLNRGLEAARGEYVARHDADDYSLPRRLAEQVAFLEQNPEVGVVGTEIQVIGEDGQVVGLSGILPSHDAIVWRIVTCRPSLAHPSVMVRRDLLLSVDGYDEEFTVTQDYDLWNRLIGSTRFANLVSPLVRYNVCGDTVSARRLDEQILCSRKVLRRTLSGLLKRAVTDEDLDVHMTFFREPLQLPDNQLDHARRQSQDLLEAMFIKRLLSDTFRSSAESDIAGLADKVGGGGSEPRSDRSWILRLARALSMSGSRP